ncbi:two-component sensor histidine kinase [Bacillus sp. MUM 116]|uniref:ATP-binding protein n=1 Tax=Bacillus sp. MUM 116 TaxID=1678002 RepID=UPI0008F5DD04|nr:ATP-binding protein [Bacillus sp. MUM 116]OIK16204.1 two-component sensor histidine kinase [Bacillus sp. MUM 116]
MKKAYNNQKLIYEEKKAIKLFLWLFNISFFSFDIFYYYINPRISKNQFNDVLKEGLGYWFYILILAAVPLAIYFIKKGNPYIIKYIYFYWYILIDFIDVLITYLGTNKPFASGNIVEVLFILFSPIFVNKKFFWTVTLGMIGKYVIVGIVLRDLNVLFPLIIYTILSIIAFILFIRFNSYIASLTSVYDELRQKEKLAVIGQMATAIGHEIRNPLSSLKGFTQLQKEQYPNTNDYYPIMIQEIDRINSIVSDLMYLGKPKVITFKSFSIEEVIAYTLSIIQQQAEKQSVVVETLIEGPLPPIECDAKQLKQVFINLFKNAIEAMIDRGKIKINAKVLKGQKMYISIQDEGCGIAGEDILNLGEPFYTTKKDGTGLGLMVSNQIIKDHKGSLKIQSNLQKGTMVEVVLPIFQ